MTTRKTKQSNASISVGAGLPKIIRTLAKLYPNAHCALRYKTPFELLVAVMLSAQCTDKKVNEVTAKLFKKYKTVAAYANADPREFERDIYSTGFYRAKTKSVLGAAKVVQRNFHGKIPKTIGEMLTIPGVGRKTANVVLGELYGTSEGIAVDTHVIRLTNMLGLTKHREAGKIEQDLMKIVPKKYWVLLPHYLILYGREYCPARHRDHSKCPLARFYIKP